MLIKVLTCPGEQYCTMGEFDRDKYIRTEQTSYTGEEYSPWTKNSKEGLNSRLTEAEKRIRKTKERAVKSIQSEVGCSHDGMQHRRSAQNVMELPAVDPASPPPGL